MVIIKIENFKRTFNKVGKKNFLKIVLIIRFFLLLLVNLYQNFSIKIVLNTFIFLLLFDWINFNVEQNITQMLNDVCWKIYILKLDKF